MTSRFLPVPLALLVIAGCGAGPTVACPAIGWSNGLTVQLDEAWREPPGGSVTVDCSSPCGWDEPDQHQVTVPISGRTAVAQLGMTTPDSAVVTVLGVDGAALARVEADLDWRRVGGSEECGGPSAATTVVPAS